MMSLMVFGLMMEISRLITNNLAKNKVVILTNMYSLISRDPCMMRARKTQCNGNLAQTIWHSSHGILVKILRQEDINKGLSKEIPKNEQMA